jgi:NAD(P)-dependent dehydrogenase (short-subunit alcohol dehydrogenase family)
VTGASKGIGESIARGLAEYGAKVVVSSRSQEAVDQVVDSMRAQGYQAEGVACNVGDEEQRNHLISRTCEVFGGVDILINNAATNPVFGKLAEAEEAAFDKIMDVNLKACFVLSNKCYPIMKTRGGGAILNIASVEGLRPSFGLGMYSISKAALIMLTKSQAKEWGRAGIRSNAICPGLIKTKFSSAIWKDENTLHHFEKQLPSGRMAEPDEMVGLALYLVSDAGSYSTGGVYTADGGYMIAG